MSPRLRSQIRQRAGSRCEYCRFPEAVAELRFQVDHVVAEKHGGTTSLENLSWACFRCNSHKGPNLAGLDERTGSVVRLFHPRQDVWEEHFRWSGPKVLGKTAIGRATVAVLRMNRLDVVLLRRSLKAEGIRF
ncbi:MAG TPA: HNH endonuclease signature motif containing protein [Prosthecobacter sp.]|jgi:hypothetical protein|nr:HNH endonuclease signature motif containing protein [Prosthecobacter sp.]